MVSTIVDELVVREHAVRSIGAEPGDRDRRPLRLADHRSTANVSVARHASSPSTRASALPRPIGPRTRSSSHRSSSTSPGSTIRLKRQSSMPAKSASLPRFSSSLKHRDRAGLRERLDDQHARHDRASRESGRLRYHSSARTVFRATAPSPGRQLEHLVDQEERLAVREDLLDRLAAERRRDGHATSESLSRSRLRPRWA